MQGLGMAPDSVRAVCSTGQDTLRWALWDPVAGRQLLASLSREWLGFDYSMRHCGYTLSSKEALCSGI